MLNSTPETVQNWPDFIRIALSQESYSSHVIFAASLLFVFVASLIGNTLTCIVIYYDKSMHTVTNYYLFNLAVSDLLVTMSILFIVQQVLTQGNELVQVKQGVLTCKFFVCIHFVFVSILWINGIWVMTALSIERYIGICYPMMLKGSPAASLRRVGKIIAGIWTFAIMATLPHILMLDIIETEKALLCFMPLTSAARILNVVLAVLTFLIPSIIMIFMYSMIVLVVNDNQNNNMKGVAISVGAKRKKINKLVALTVSFVICWLPFFLLRIITFAFDVKHFTHLLKYWPIANKVAMFHSWFTTVLNPLLFSVMSTKFRKALRMLWNRKWKKGSFKLDKSISHRNHTRTESQYY